MSSRERTAGVLRAILVAIPPASGAVVMDTGIVSIGLTLDHHETLSRVRLVIGVRTWLTARRARRRPCAARPASASAGRLAPPPR
jgi:hypothetical protein